MARPSSGGVATTSFRIRLRKGEKRALPAVIDQPVFADTMGRAIRRTKNELDTNR
ncbi:MAG: hypothetical protein BWZ02_03143 [Lentisphaerae bacterium ADurb.BinA184]|nr:MAG: hypothetical protein BWZ02_03143 [Lentisphaerae bacterium ADurb.BinA184]